jgi:hypothetical protein
VAAVEMAEEVKRTRGGALAGCLLGGRAVVGAGGREKGREEGDSGHQADRLREEDDQKNIQVDSLLNLTHFSGEPSGHHLHFFFLVFLVLVRVCAHAQVCISKLPQYSAMVFFEVESTGV